MILVSVQINPIREDIDHKKFGCKNLIIKVLSIKSF
ncbi:hypothetical protein RUMTOR_02641 [[Ruminococcus] torques ATCC 27756]|uniref:Uncharacterized protein n=1 Tax=[Ruminococcus] torques ATCC 27756 TaxID=411460 RepID=A5KQV0_9FIRM|nr:hypothetical protein RUMTOR_02641 [[Ruminococcus] torques ATCC 27756]